ncbi:MAG: hypothetical protein WCB63_16560, partial [Polyangiales bacterium]
MRSKSPAPIVTIWSSAYLGSLLFLLAGLLPQGTVSLGLLAQLSWLALIASIPTSLVLAAACRMTVMAWPLVAATTLAVVLWTMAVGWEHIDFLLSGPQWLDLPRRQVLGVALLFALGSLAGLGWIWLILGAGIRRGRSLAIWIAQSTVLVAVLTAAIMRYRAYDYTM